MNILTQIKISDIDPKYIPIYICSYRLKAEILLYSAVIGFLKAMWLGTQYIYIYIYIYLGLNNVIGSLIGTAININENQELEHKIPLEELQVMLSIYQSHTTGNPANNMANMKLEAVPHQARLIVQRAVTALPIFFQKSISVYIYIYI